MGSLKILYLKGDLLDAESIKLELNNSFEQVEVKTISNKTEFIKLLKVCNIDIIISDYHIPSFNELEAYSLARSKCPHIPFIIISNAIGEEKAIELLKAGITDYVVKDNLGKLPIAIKRALKEVEEIKNKIEVENKLRKNEQFKAEIFNALSSHIVVLNDIGKIISTNNAWDHFAMKNGLHEMKSVGVGINYLEVLEKVIETDEEIKIIYDGIKGVLNKKRTYFYFDYPCHSPTEQRWYTLRATPLNEQGGIVITHTNITERILAKNEIKEYEQYFEVSQGLLCIANTEGFFVKINPMFSKILGYTNSDLLATPFMNFVHSEDVASTKLEIEKLAKGIPTIKFINRYRTKSGEYKWLRWSATPNTKTGMLYASALDITEEVRAENDLQKTKNELSNIINYANIGIAFANKDNEIISANKKFQDILDCKNESDLIGKTIETFTHPDDLKEDLNYLNQIRKGEISSFDMEKRYISYKNETKWVDLNVSVVKDPKTGDIINFIATVIDITERKKVEGILEAISEMSSTHSGDRYFSEICNLLCNVLNIKYAFVGRYNQKNNSVNTFGFSILGETQKNIIYNLHYTPCQEVLISGACVYPSKVQQLFPKDKDLVHLGVQSYIGVPLIKGKKAQGLMVVMDDKPMENSQFITTILEYVINRTLTEVTRTITEIKLQESEERYRGLIENSSEVTCIIDENGKIKYVSPSIESILEYSVKEHTGTNVFDFLHPEDWKTTQEKIEVRLKNGGVGEYNFYRLRSKSGDYKYFRAILSNHFDTPSINGFIINAQDATQLIAAEQEKFRAIIQTEEKERQRLAHDLHDGLGQTIAAANMYFNTLDIYAKQQLSEETYALFETGKKLINNSALETRIVSHNIMPRSLKEFGLEKTIKELINNYQKISPDIQFEVVSDLKNYRFSEETELTIFRSIQELLNNSVKHANATEIKVSMIKTGHKCIIELFDNGKGFDKKNNSSKVDGGLGLVSIPQRIKAIGGSFLITSKQNKGTKAIILIKLNKHDN